MKKKSKKCIFYVALKKKVLFLQRQFEVKVLN